MPNQTEEQRKRAFKDADVIDATVLEPVKPITVPPTVPETDMGATADSSLQSLLDTFNKPTETEQTSTDLQARILESLDVVGGETTRKAQLEEEAGLQEQREELQGVINQLQALSKQRQAIPLKLQQEAKGRGITKGGLAPIQASQIRKNTIEALGLAAIGQTLQGNISLAESSIKNALDAEFEPERIKLATLQQLYVFNKDILEREDKKKADSLAIFLNERDRILKLQEADKKGIYDIGTLAVQNGADSTTAQRIFEAKTKEEAIVLASGFMQSPEDKVNLQNALLETQLNKIRIEKEAEELNIFRQYGGLTPKQWGEQKKAEEKERKTSLEKFDLAKDEVREANQSITQINSIINSPALDTVVGTNIFARGTGRQKGIVSTGISFIGGIFTGGTTTGIVDEFRKADDTVALTEQIISQLFLDKLITVKGKGATFGQLSDREGNSLRSASNAIGATKIEKAGKVIGYDMSEKEFKKQMGIILESLELAKENASGNVLPEDDPLNDILNSIYGGETATFNPTF